MPRRIGLGACGHKAHLRGNEIGPGGGHTCLQGKRRAVRLRSQASRVHLLQLKASQKRGILILPYLRVEPDQGLSGHDTLALTHEDLGDPAAARMIDHLDPPRRLDLSGRPHHLVDPGPGRPADERHDQRCDDEDEGAGQRRRAALDQRAGIVECPDIIRFGQHRHALS